jgi:hypothetical protein
MALYAIVQGNLWEGKGGNKAEQKIYVKNKEKNDRARRIEKKMKL